MENYYLKNKLYMEHISNRIIIWGANLQYTYGLMRAFGECGIKVTVLLDPCDKKFCYLRFSKYIEKIHYLNTVDDGLKILYNEYWNEKEKPIILCSSDVSICMLDANYNTLKDHFYIFNSNNEQGRISYLMDKTVTFPIAEKCGFNVIKTWEVSDPNEVPDDITFPCITKGRNSSTSTKKAIHVCYNRKELLNSLKSGIDYLVQEYIEKDYELCLVGFSYNHGENVINYGVVKKIRDGLQRQSTYIRIDDIKKYPLNLKESVKSFLAEIKYDGLFGIDLIQKNGKYYFLEINLRNDGTTFLSTSAGANYPMCWAKYCIGSLTQDYINSIQFHTPHFLMQMDDLYNIFDGKVKICNWIKEALSTQAHYVMNKKDYKPFLYQCYMRSKQLIKKILY